MYVIRRIAKAQPGKVWQVVNLLIKICAAYEENGRPAWVLRLRGNSAQQMGVYGKEQSRESAIILSKGSG